MSRPNKPWFRKANKTWYIWFDGRQVNLGKNKKVAFQQFHELMAQPREQRIVPKTQNLSVPEVVDYFLEWVERHRSPETYEWYRHRLERLCQKYSDLAADQLKPYHVEEWVSQYEIAVTTKRNYYRSIKRCYKWANRQGHMTANPIADLEVPSAETKEVFIEPEEFARLMSYVKNQALADLITVTWETGCRPQESLRVEATNVDVEHQRWVFYKSQSKGKRVSRVVYLTDKAMEIVQRLMIANPSGPIFRNLNGKPWTKDAVNCAFLAIQMRMGKDRMQEEGICISDEEIKTFAKTLKPTKSVKGEVRDKRPAEIRAEAKRKLTHKKASEVATRYSLYTLRHSYATNALRKGIDSLTVAILLGHQDPSTLARVYQHLNQNPEHLLSQAKEAVK